MKKFLIIVSAVIVGGIILFVGCAALVGESIDDVEDDAKSNAISVQEFKSVKMGDSLLEVKESLGDPKSKQVDIFKGTRTVYLYYAVDNDQLLDDYQFVFEDGKLRSKSDS